MGSVSYPAKYSNTSSTHEARLMMAIIINDAGRRWRTCSSSRVARWGGGPTDMYTRPNQRTGTYLRLLIFSLNGGHAATL